MYDKNSPYDSINESRKELFCRRNRAMDKLPPTHVRIYLVEEPHSAAILLAIGQQKSASASIGSFSYFNAVFSIEFDFSTLKLCM